jgi:ESS family glutamate:Na+ symporter
MNMREWFQCMACLPALSARYTPSKEIDPSFKTPAANNLLTGSSFAIALGAPMLVLIGMAPKSDTLLFVVLGLQIIYLILLLMIMLKVNRKKVSA